MKPVEEMSRAEAIDELNRRSRSCGAARPGRIRSEDDARAELEQVDRLDVRRVREHVDRPYPREPSKRRSNC